jgi:tellurite resistance protein TehA-like permease
MTLVWLFPVITLIVGASAGGVLVNPLQEFSASHALLTLTFSVFMLTIGFTLAFMMLTLYLLRLIVHGQPPGASILSSFFPLGVTGQTGFTLLLIGLSFKSLLPLQYGNSKLLTSSTTGDIINVICIYTAFVLWSLGVMWTIFALLAVQDVLRETRFPFKVTHWGLIFPNVRLSSVSFHAVFS